MLAHGQQGHAVGWAVAGLFGLPQATKGVVYCGF
jgi:hypothetical protein